ncbi:cell division control protein 14, SIN component-domain-containing protein [Multifurca ochricompacta]|uniref:Cell division control protein 14, SIN component-domain-containing protein n=1 Tax=Multifurca ochricompacta TaxID=376703 RepID=A0AAD4MDN3_9AGAM|nr:cell division control protein 14, SIN component-domain-containing protein [Multifurca ochricompacta]
MNDNLGDLHETLQDYLDVLASARSSTTARSRALENLGTLITRAFSDDQGSLPLWELLSLQNTFECNIASRIMSWVSGASHRLDALLQRGLSDGQRQAEASNLSSQLPRPLSSFRVLLLRIILQKSSLVENILLTSNSKQPTPSVDERMNDEETAPSSALPNAVLDTLLCILVDSSRSLRAFEDCNGVQTIVKLLKRAHTPRDVRMKCLEFLYFYLMDETSPRSELPESIIEPTHLPTMPLSPSPFIDFQNKPRHFAPGSRTASSGSEDSFASSGSSRSSSSSTSLSSLSTPSHAKFSPTMPKTPPSSMKPSIYPYAKPRSLLMLQREVDFIPATPKKPHTSRLGVDPLRPSSTPNSPFKNFRAVPDSNFNLTSGSRHSSAATMFGGEQDISCIRSSDNRDIIKTTEQKKEFLVFMLGNVDALVEGVKRAGIWGLS